MQLLHKCVWSLHQIAICVCDSVEVASGHRTMHVEGVTEVQRLAGLLTHLPRKAKGVVVHRLHSPGAEAHVPQCTSRSTRSSALQCTLVLRILPHGGRRKVPSLAAHPFALARGGSPADLAGDLSKMLIRPIRCQRLRRGAVPLRADPIQKAPRQLPVHVDGDALIQLRAQGLAILPGQAHRVGVDQVCGEEPRAAGGAGVRGALRVALVRAGDGVRMVPHTDIHLRTSAAGSGFVAILVGLQHLSHLQVQHTDLVRAHIADARVRQVIWVRW
mmetsp:Transcript_36226/g.94942  ORF Transcript_36226/g.94942 Transcript_36226/m.94942 type:complete len:273 (+) Transcript_36226:4616-5434(+)